MVCRHDARIDATPGAHDAFNALDVQDLYVLTYTSSPAAAPCKTQ
jgi:hypothetical protein